MTRRELLFSAAAIPALRPGAEIVLRPGVYQGFRIPRECAGVTIRSEVKWKAVVLGSEGHGISIEAPGVTIDGLEIAGSRIDGVKASADGATIRNCWLHNNASMGIAIHGFHKWTIERSLIEFNGQHPQLHHGVYADGEDGVVRSNIVRHNSGYGLQLYPAMRGVTVVNNVIHGHSTKGGMVLAAPSGRSLIVNNTIADNAYGIRLMGGSGQVVANNVIAGPAPISGDGEPVLTANWTDDAKFADRGREVYFLAKDSPARGKGDPKLAPSEDFWGRKRKERVDPGALPFLAGLDAWQKSWHNGWAYRFASTDPKMDMPDLWSPPA